MQSTKPATNLLCPFVSDVEASARSRIMPALPQTATPRTQIQMPRRITQQVSQGTVSHLLSSGIVEPTAVMIPMMSAKPRDNPSHAIPKPKVALPRPQARPKPVTVTTVVAPAFDKADNQ